MQEALLARLKLLQSDIQEGLVVTPAPTLEAYYEKVGQIRGIQSAIDAMLDLMRANEQDDI